jgi:hypothetical protein
VGKLKRVGPATRKSEPAKTTVKGGWWGPFLEDWGRVAVPVGIGLVLAALRYLDILDDASLGLSIGVIVLAGLATAFGVIVWRNEFPKWVRVATFCAAGAFLVGVVFPFVMTVYPGTPVFSESVSKDRAEVPVKGVDGGAYTLEVYASSLADSAETRATEGQYKFAVGGTEVSGKFSDSFRSVRAGKRGTRQVEMKHLMEVHPVSLDEGEKALKVVRLDAQIGPEVRVSLYPVLLPPVISYILFGLVMLFGIILDGIFTEQTEKWRLSLWPAVGAAFLLIFGSAYERGNVTSAAIWSGIFGGVAGFLGGWLLSIISRKVFGKARTRL